MKRVLAAIAASALFLVGCGGSPEPEPEPTTVAAPSPEPTTEEPTTPEPTTEPPPPPVWPLTGALVEDPAQAGQHPVIGIKVENSSAARPWVNLQPADIVFVEMVEGGITRFNAVYNSVLPDVVGPVRSLRPMDAAILGQWNGTLLASGGQPQFVDRVESAVGLRTMDRGDAGFYRERSRRAPHNVMVDLTTVAPTLEPSGEFPVFAEYAPGTSSTAGGEAASSVQVNYPGATSRWDFDAGSGVYFRFDRGTASLQVDGSHVYSQNVLVLRVETQNTGAKDPAGNPVPETLLNGSGELHLFQGGTLTAGTWSKGGDNDPFVFTDANGAPLALAEGNTWVELLPTQGTISWE
nr:DUF3048 domain-containing protein [Actinomycetales bacterium]